jgi:hypothetical protein
VLSSTSIWARKGVFYAQKQRELVFTLLQWRAVPD